MRGALANCTIISLRLRGRRVRLAFSFLSSQALLHSIRTRLYALPPHTRVVCGHGPETTIGRERTNNPFVRL